MDRRRLFRHRRGNEDGSFRYTPGAGFTGTDTFAYRAGDGELESNLATVTVAVANDLGAIQTVQLPRLNPSEGDLWYAFRTTRNGLITLWAQNADDVTITLYDENLNELTVWNPINDDQDLEWSVEEGEKFYFCLRGTDRRVNVHLANVIQRSSITINGVEYRINPAKLNLFSVDGSDSDGRVVIRSSFGDDVLRLYPYSANLTGPGYCIDVVNAAEITFIGGGGNDKAYLYDSAGNDVFVATTASGTLSGDGFRNCARGFDRVWAFATAGGNDLAIFSDSPGNDVFIGTPDHAELYGNGFYRFASNFDRVHARATAGGNDLAVFHDSPGNDTFIGTPAYAELYGNGFYLLARNFDRV
ncbi:MAG: Ig-like domain-containing protein, partial [Planctomycetota bacterium]